MAYATPDNLAAAFDRRDIADLASDSGNPAPRLDCEVVRFALERASGDIDAAALIGRVYTESELEQLTGNGRAMLIGLVCERAMAYLMQRRTAKFGDQVITAMLERSEQFLEALRQGNRVFPVESVLGAGLPTVDGPSALDYQRLNLITDRTRNFYPSRASRLPLGRGGD
jgi:phage gp36-like protein